MAQHHKMSVAFLTMPISSKVPAKPGHILRGAGRSGKLLLGHCSRVQGEPLEIFTTASLGCKKIFFNLVVQYIILL